MLGSFGCPPRATALSVAAIQSFWLHRYPCCQPGISMFSCGGADVLCIGAVLAELAGELALPQQAACGRSQTLHLLTGEPAQRACTVLAHSSLSKLSHCIGKPLYGLLDCLLACAASLWCCSQCPIRPAGWCIFGRDAQCAPGGRYWLSPRRFDLSGVV